MKPVHSTASLLAAILLLAACAPAGRPTDAGPSVQELAATIAAATIQAGLAPTSTPTALPTIPPIAPTAEPTLSIHADNSACRSGPGADFKVIAMFPAGTTVKIVGKATAQGYWIVLDPASQASCWVQAQDGTPAGSFDAVPEMTPQVTAGNVPAKPAFLRWPFYCSYNADGSYTLTVQLSWTDASSNENGFRIYRAGAQIADLPANTNTYNETVPVPADTVIIYGVQAYNDAGASAQLLSPSGSKSGSNAVACKSPTATATP
jgi:hypothetical protein